jgi:transposase
VLVDTLGLLLHALVHSAHVQDREGGILLLISLADRFPWLKKLFADGAYQGPVFSKALAKVRPQLKTAIVKRSEQALGFVVVPKRWIVWSGRSPGSIAVVVWPRILRTVPALPPLSFSSPPSLEVAKAVSSLLNFSDGL